MSCCAVVVSLWIGEKNCSLGERCPFYHGLSFGHLWRTLSIHQDLLWMKPRVAAGISMYSVVGTGPNPTALEFVEGLEDVLPEPVDFWSELT